ncbi:hypothetical protein [Bacillus sp. T33-2]|uniref:hypothetical protein n=1 Tax=Bacillus sp. T33-2 TaxID=2054168 RepID=UPI000C781091|nr:hypothetical protein [Bacillus sp. T33-2]PLR99591.1 hypothetical protein CVD19_00580 [Bacillus sp. T33-2]
MKRSIGDKVKINPYNRIEGEIISRKDKANENHSGFDYIVKLNIPQPTKDTIYTFNYDKEKGYWWQFFNDKELDILEQNYEAVSQDRAV